MTHLFRPVDTPDAPTPPVGRGRRSLLAVKLAHILARCAPAALSARTRLIVTLAVYLVGVVVQVLLLWITAYLVDLSVSLAELWAELARKHLEITL